MRNRLRKNTSVCLSAAVALGASFSVHAAGFGEHTVLSALGQPLRAEIELVSTPAELDQLQVRLAAPEYFQRAGVEYTTLMGALQFSIGKRGDGHTMIEIRSSEPVNDPYLDLLVEVDSPTGPLIRRFVFLLDPMEYAVRAGGSQSTRGTPAAVTAGAVADTSGRDAPVDTSAGATAAPREAEGTMRGLRSARTGAGQSASILPHARGGAARDDQPLNEDSPARSESSLQSARSEPSAELAGSKPPVQSDAITTDVSSYRVKPGDTLGWIAHSMRPPGFPVTRMQEALFRLNPDAFIHQDINQLRAGSILSLPALTQPLSALAPAGLVEHDAGMPQVPVMQSAVPPGSSTLPTTQADHDYQAAVTKVAELEAQVTQMQEALKQVDGQIARLQESGAASDGPAGAQAPAESTSRAPGPAAIPNTPAAASDSVPHPAPAPMDGAPNPSPASAATDSANHPSPAPAPTAGAPHPSPAPATTAGAPHPSPSPAATPASASDWLDWLDNLSNLPVLPFAGVGAALLGAFAFRWYRGKSKARRRRPAAHDFSELSIEPDGQTVTATNLSLQTDFSQAGIGQIDTDDIDPVAEADVYVAYGRDAQAEEILKEALRQDPNRDAVNVKLLEIYAGRNDLTAFNTLAAALFKKTQGIGGDWKRAAALGLELDPGNPMYKPSGVSPQSASSRASAADATVPPHEGLDAIPVVADAAAVTDASAETEPPHSGATQAEAVAAHAAAPEVHVAEPIPGGTSTDTLEGLAENFDFDLNLDEMTSAAEAPHLDLELPLTVGPGMPGGAPDGAKPRGLGLSNKLQLAEAYRNMGDHQGAKELLGQVLTKGSPSQQEHAKKLLEGIGEDISA